MSRKPPPYAPEYRRQMVELVRTGRPPGGELAREFECSASAIRNWVRQTDRDEGRREDGLTSSELKELRQLRRENRQLREEREVVVVPPGGDTPTVWRVSLRLEPGTAVGIAGPSGSGKVTLDGAALDQYGEAARAKRIGWLAQEVVLFDATVAENIARLAPDPDPEAVVRAARRSSSAIARARSPGATWCS